MRHFSLLLVGFVSLLCFGCGKPYSVGELWIRNESGQDVFVESSIESATTSQISYFVLKNGAEKYIAQSRRYPNEVLEYIPLTDYIHNEDAYVSIYTISDKGDKLLAHKWYYSDRDNDGHELFSEKSLTQDVGYLLDGGYFPRFTFTILPEDI
ncbi:MAG: hypothetical protein IJS30_05190 [Bacteroidales bacterium]|nr:hypothetical protein [Bacteroidales bacterium]